MPRVTARQSTHARRDSGPAPERNDLANPLWQAVTGACMVEYGLVVGLVAAMCISTVTTLGQAVSQCFTTAMPEQISRASFLVGGF